MLEALRIRDLGVIEDVEIELAGGLCVVTGETGAGKTMVVTGLQLLFGGRADATRVRAGAEQATVEGRVKITGAEPAAARALDAGAQIDDDELILRRTVTVSGRSRAQLGGTSVPVGVLGAVGEDLFVVHGQADQMRLARPGEQRRAVDRAAGIDLGPYRAAFEQWQIAERRLAERTRDRGALMRETELLTYGLAEIDAVSPTPGEDADLAAVAARLAAADELRLAGRVARDALTGDPDDPGAEAEDVRSLLARAQRALTAVAGADQAAAALADRLLEVGVAAQDLAGDLAHYVDSLEADPARLAQVESRRSDLTRLARKYGPPGAGGRGDIDDVLDWGERARSRLAEIDTSDDALARLGAQRDRARDLAQEQARSVTERRRAAADRLAGDITAELAGLAMAQARLVIEVRPRAVIAGAARLPVSGGGAVEGGAAEGGAAEGGAAEGGAAEGGAAKGGEAGAGPDGVDEVEFLLAPSADSPARPLGRGASGGELSRVMLAVEVVLAGSDPVPVMVFDEVDAGVGGRAAVEVGRRLSRLARVHQVIVVTHLAQVAAFADLHLVVGGDGPGRAPSGEASEEDSGHHRTRSVVTRVEGTERLIELARMLAGRDTSAARRHAAELLADARSS